MKMRMNIGVITAGSVLVLGVASFRPSSNARSASAIKVSLQDMSGKPLSSLFDGMPIDKRYPAFKRLVTEQRSQRCGQRPSQARRLLQELGFWFEPVVHAGRSDIGKLMGIECSCGYTTYKAIAFCTQACGGYAYDFELARVQPPAGIKSGPRVCTKPPPADCPGEITTSTCNCPPP